MTGGRTVLAAATILACLGAPPLVAAVPAGLDAAPAGLAPAGTPAIDRDGTSSPAPGDRARGNPLWGIPLSILSATRERPIFLPSRRPVAPVVAAPVAAPAEPVAAPPAPEMPRLVLLGAIVGEGEGEAIAIFLDQATNGVIRLRTGQKHGDWVLRSVRGRAATLRKGDEDLQLQLPAPGSAPAVPGSVPALVVPAAASGAVPGSPGIPGAGPLVIPDPSMGAPFVPRSTPKNKESDGL